MITEVVNPLTLPSLSLQERRSLPECAAVYFVLNSNDKILYIGGTVNLAQRWVAHHRWYQLVEMDDDIRLAWLECSDTVLLLEIEAALIKQFQPSLNRKPQAYGGQPRYKQQGIETATVGVVLPKEIKLRLDRVAKDKGWSVSQTAASAIEEWLDLVEPPSVANQKKGAA